jgi:hypothetical protein
MPQDAPETKEPHMLRLLALTLIVAAVAAPASLAMHAPGDNTSSIQSTATADQLDARLGPKYVTVRSVSPDAPVTATREPWHWLVPAAAILLLAGVVTLRLRRSHEPGAAAAGLRARQL